VCLHRILSSISNSSVWVVLVLCVCGGSVMTVAGNRNRRGVGIKENES